MPTLNVQSSVRHRLDGEDLARHFADRRSALSQPSAGVTGLAGRLQVESRDRVAARHDADVAKRGLGNQHILIVRRLRFDEFARAWRSHLLVRRQQEGDRQRRRNRRGAQLANGFQGGVIAALHVKDARPEALISVATPRQFLQRSQRVDSIHVASDEDPGFAGLTMGKAGANATAETCRAPRGARCRGPLRPDPARRDRARARPRRGRRWGFHTRPKAAAPATWLRRQTEAQRNSPIALLSGRRAGERAAAFRRCVERRLRKCVSRRGKDLRRCDASI